MSCEHYQQLLHLNRLNEISESEAADLRQHLRHCEPCSLEWRRIQHAEEFLDPLRLFSPAPPNPEQLTADIMRRVRDVAGIKPSENVIDRILDFFLIPGVRYSAVAAISCVMITLVVQSLFLLDSISNLEDRMVSASGQQSRTIYTARSETLHEVAKSAQAQPLVRSLPFTVTSGYVRVPGQAIDVFLSDGNLGNLPVIVGSSALRVDRKTLEKIVSEIRATIQLTFHAG